VSESEIPKNKKEEKIKERVQTRSQSQTTALESQKVESRTQTATASVQTVAEETETEDSFESGEEEQNSVNETDSEVEMAESSLLPNFSGSENVEEWIHSLYNYATYKKFDEATRAAFFKLKLTGLAKTWLEGLEEEVLENPAELFKQFKERFQTTDIVKQKKIRDIFTVKQQAYETVDTYVGRISTIAQQCGLSEELVINAVSLGLRPAIAAFVMENSPTTINDVVRYARTAEITRQGNVENTEALNSQISSLGQQLTEMNSKISQLTTAATQAKINPPSTPAHTEGSNPSSGRYREGQFRPRYQNGTYNRPYSKQQGQRNWYQNQAFPNMQSYNPQFPNPQNFQNQNGSGPIGYTTDSSMGQRPQGPSGSMRPQGPVRRCYICNKTSHLARDCWYKQPQSN
jgi:Retrotransposon gag protein